MHCNDDELKRHAVLKRSTHSLTHRARSLKPELELRLLQVWELVGLPPVADGQDFLRGVIGRSRLTIRVSRAPWHTTAF